MVNNSNRKSFAARIHVNLDSCTFSLVVGSKDQKKYGDKIMKNIKVDYYLPNSMEKIHSKYTKTYPRNTMTKELLYTFIRENIMTFQK